MAYTEEIVNIAVGMVLKDHHSIREVARLLHLGRVAVARWVDRIQKGLPTHFSSAPKQVHNRTGENVLQRIKKLLQEGAGTIKAWLDSGKKTCLRIIQRWKAKWFPEIKEKPKIKRYERKKVFSLAHTDWGTKRIGESRRCCFTFYVDDASRRLYGTYAYPKADYANTFDALHRAMSKAPFKAEYALYHGLPIFGEPHFGILAFFNNFDLRYRDVAELCLDLRAREIIQFY